MPYLLVLFIIPFAAAILLLALPTMPAKALKSIATGLSLLPLLLLITLHTQWIGAEIDSPWLSALSIHFHLKIDTLSLIFLYITSFVVPMSLITYPASAPSPHLFYLLALSLQGLLIGLFTAADLALVTIFWEATLLPVYFIISLWGKTESGSAAMKFLIYMIAGSVMMVAAVLMLYLTSLSLHGGGTFNIEALAAIAQQSPHVSLIAAIFLLAFAVKTPLFPFHGWLPNAYCQASTAGTILLAGILSKVGIYGILRIGIPFFPTLLQEWSPVLMGFAIAGVLYGAFAAWGQSDYKRLLAYSSLSHVNFILVGLFIWNETAHIGALLQVMNHAITITALFLVAGWLEERIKTTSMEQPGGLAKYLPKLCWLTLFFVLASVALPGTNNFVGEILIFFGLFNENPWLTLLLGLSVILSVVYMLRWMKETFFGPASHFPVDKPPTDIKTIHLVIASPLIMLVLCIGIYPSVVISAIKTTLLETVGK